MPRQRFLFIFVGLLGLYLQSYYFYHLHCAPFALFGFLLIFIWISFFTKGRLRLCLPEIGMATAVIASTAWAFLSQSKSGLMSVSLKPALSFLLGIGLLSWVRRIVPRKATLAMAEFAEALKYIICIQLFFWFAEFIGFYLFQEKFDLLHWATGEAQRTQYYTGTFNPLISEFYRACGLFNEPSTYCLFMCIGYFFLKLKKTFSNSLIEFLIILSVLLTFSLTGFLTLLAVLLFLFLRKRQLKRSVYYAFAVALFLSFTHLQLTHGLMQTIGRISSVANDPSAQQRIQVTTSDVVIQYEGTQWGPMFLGKGLGHNDPALLAGSGLNYFIKYMGILGSIIFLYFLALWSKQTKALAPVCCILFCFLINAPLIQQPIFWVMIAFCAIQSQGEFELLS